MRAFVEKLVKRLESEKDLVPVNRVIDDIINDKPKELGQLMAYNKALKIIEELSCECAESHNTDWIPCSEGFPAEKVCDDGYIAPSEKVLVITKAGDYLTSRYWGNRRRGAISNYSDWVDIDLPVEEVAYWMPLPENPYKKGE